YARVTWSASRPPSPRAPARIPHGNADPRVGRPVVQVPAPVERDQPLHERRSLGVLPGPLVILRGPEERRVRAGNQLQRIAGSEQRLTRGIHPRGQRRVAILAAVARVIQQDNPVRGEESGRTGLDQPGVEVPRAGREDLDQPAARVGQRRPIDEVVGGRDEDVGDVEVHPVLPAQHGWRPICTSPLLSSARYSTYTFPSRTTAAGLKVAYSAHRTMLSLTGERNVAAGSGVRPGLTRWGFSKGPSIHPGPCPPSAPSSDTHASAATARRTRRP